MEPMIFYGGPILTMEREGECPQALLVQEGIVEALGRVEELRELCPKARLQDLGGHTLLPSFIDSHSHITAYAQTLRLCPLEEAGSLEDVARRLVAFREEHHLAPGEWVIGFGYDHNHLKERRHPDKVLLDAALPENPVLLSHKSGHMGVVNSAALEFLGIDAGTPNPQGGLIAKGPDGTPTGYLEETAFFTSGAKLPQPTLDDLLDDLVKAQEVYFSYGVTTIQDGLTRGAEWQLLAAAAQRGLLKADVVSFLDQNQCRDLFLQNRDRVGRYQNHLKLGGYKVVLDGSPQGRTAWLSKPYEHGEDGYRGYPAYPDETVDDFIAQAAREGVQVLVHCNGDAASGQFIAACRKAGTESVRAIRPVMIHAQTVRRDQLPEMAELSITASFFVAHTYYWGDVHLENLGPTRAKAISPMASALAAGVPCTLHQDTPVLPPDMIDTLWCACNRKSLGGADMGQEERVTPYEALKAVTSVAAWQYFEEDVKGSLRPGKLADLVVLSGNPLETPPERLRELQVLETYKEGQLVYRK